MSGLREEHPLVCLLTDFGLKDPYVGMVKGVLASQTADVHFVDLTHEIPPQDIRSAAYHLLSSYQYFSPDTLFLCVVDPGVGSQRKILYVEAGEWRFMAPDNGLLSWVLEREKPDLLVDVSLAVGASSKVSRTFHGRDIMAPVAARILNGAGPKTLGPTVNTFVRLPFPKVEKQGSMWRGEILSIDSFGNIVTNFVSEEVVSLAQSSKVWLEWGQEKESVRGLVDSYSSVEPGKLLMIPGSFEFVELAARESSAAVKTNLKVGDAVTLHFRT